MALPQTPQVDLDHTSEVSHTASDQIPVVKTQMPRPHGSHHDYEWSPPEHAYLLRHKPPTKPWAFFVGDSLIKYINPASIVSGGQISRKIHPHSEAGSLGVNYPSLNHLHLQQTHARQSRTRHYSDIGGN